MLRQLLLSLVFASPKPLSAAQLLLLIRKGNAQLPNPPAELQEVTEATLHAALLDLQKEWQEHPCGLQLLEIAGGWRCTTSPESAPWVRLLFDEPKPSKLSQPALETLAIIAYRQPISRADIEAVRGVAVDGVISTLLERRLIKLAGRSEAPGKPLLYETTVEFLETFGLKGLTELPNADELRRIPIPKAAPNPVAASPAPSEEPAQGTAPATPEATDATQPTLALDNASSQSSPPTS